MSEVTKNLWEEFAQFFENPSREGLRKILQNNLGEFDHLDFKGEWPDLHKIARHILGFANSGGGCLVCGVATKDDKSLEIVGLHEFLDKADFSNGIEKFIPTQLKPLVMDFVYEAAEYPAIVGKKFQVIMMENTPEYIPFVSRADGKGIRNAAIYVRRGTETVEANYDELQNILNRRFETGYSTRTEFNLQEELAELKTLYQNIPKYKNSIDFSTLATAFNKPNSIYPAEDFEDFVAHLIQVKKTRIDKIVNKIDKNI